MNSGGHLAFGMLLGSAYLLLTTHVTGLQGAGAIGLTLAGVAVGSRAPDIDHKTSTASKLITPVSPSLRRQFRHFGSLVIVIGVLLFALRISSRVPGLAEWTGHVPEAMLASAPLWLGGGLLCLLLAMLRDLILLGAGALLLYAYHLYHLSWFFAFLGIAVIIIPLVRHRGVIHTPEFAVVLTVGGMSLVAALPWIPSAIVIGLVIGWWLHLAGDIFGEEGIESLFARFFPFLRWLKLALHLFRNGGTVEKLIIRWGWLASFAIWGLMAWQSLHPDQLTIDKMVRQAIHSYQLAPGRIGVPVIDRYL